MVAPIAPNIARMALTQLTGRSDGDNLQNSLQALGMNKNMAALQGALQDLSLGNLAGYQKNLFEAFTGVDPGRIGARMAKPFSCQSPAQGLGVSVQRMDLANKGGKLAAFATGFALGGLGGGLAAMAGKGIFARCKAKSLEKRLTRDPMFRATFEAQVGGRFVPDGRNDGKITLVKPNFGLPGLNPGIFGAMSGNLVAGGCLSGIARMMGNAQGLMQDIARSANTSYDGSRFGDRSGLASTRADSAVAKLGPGATFEDLVAAFMIDTVKDMQKEIEDKMKELKKSNESQRGGRGGYGSMLGGLGKMAGGAIGGVFGGPIGAGIGGQLGGALGGAVGGGGGAKGNGQSDMRQIKFEELKNLMNKLQQMLQSMSNVLNTMHQGAMNSIRNIRA